MNFNGYSKRGTDANLKLRRVQMRSGQELADEFDVTINLFGRLLRNYNGPKKIQTYSSQSHTKTYFDAELVRAWWKTVPDEAKRAKAA